jgi:hypothetical protein
VSSIVSNYLGNAVLLDYFYNSDTYVALHLTDPTVLGSLATELAGGDYERELATWTSPSSKTIGLATAIVYDNLPACTLGWFGVWDAPSNGHLLTAVEIIGGLPVAASARLVVPAGDIAVTF